jgi:beta-galactosidase
VATDNGDQRSFVPFASTTREAFSGLCLAIVRGKPGQPGEITVTVTADGLEAGSVSITTEK